MENNKNTKELNNNNNNNNNKLIYLKNSIKGIVLFKLLIIILVIILFFGFIYLNFSTDISQTLDICRKVVTHQINLDDEIVENETLLGITDVKGQGIIINILDGKDMIHQEDVIILIDELKNSGAQAISVNEQRITNSSYLYCDGAVILIDNQKIGNPFTIKAIGDKETLHGAVLRNKGYISILEKDGIQIDVKKDDNIQISKTNNPELLNYSKGKNKIGALKESNKLIGKSSVQGKGIEITIHEDKSKLTALSFLQYVNDLRSAGAKAISINGQRITNMTDIMDISNTYVLVNSIPISAPFTIKAIGDIDKIEEALYYNNSQYSKIKTKGNSQEIYEYSRLKIDKYIQKKDKDKMAYDFLK